MVDKLHMAIPVFLPGNNRDWAEWAGMATITENGDITIKLQDKKAAESLTKMARDGVLLQLAFDYRMPIERVEQINSRYKENK